VRLSATTWDVLIIGGGATGLGSALEAALRGLKVALVEADDYAAHTSSASTKLVHGGVRYLEKAFKGLDYGQYKLVREALHERARLLANAPHLCHPLPTLLPVYSAWQKFYYGMGLRVYDWVAQDSTVPRAHGLNKTAALEAFPALNPQGLQGGLVYYDGQFDDARLAVALARTARKAGATVLNHVRLTDFAQHTSGAVVGAAVRDELTGQTYRVQANAYLNCTGATADRIRQMARPRAVPRLRPSRGIHIVLPREVLPGDNGLIVPSKDGRVIFVLPWFHCVLVGTTDVEASADAPVQPTHEEVRFLLDETARYLRKPITYSDIRGIFAGNRPLVAASQGRTEALIRNHEVEVFKTERVINVLGGKWTTYRQMAQEAVDAVQLNLGYKPSKSPTPNYRLLGGEAPAPDPAPGFAPDLRLHLRTYGTELPEMEALLKEFGTQPLASGFPYTQADVRFAIQYSQALTIEDVLARRIRLEIEDLRAARSAAPAVAKLLAQAYDWPTDYMLDQIAAYQARVDGLLAYIQPA